MSSSVAAEPSVVYRFDRFELLPATEELRKNGTRVHLPPQPFRVLLFLVQRAGTMVTREELQEMLWGAESEAVFVDYEQGINTAIRRIRYALNDHAELPHFLQTVRRRGYCFVAPVECVAATPAAHTVALRLVDELSSGAAGLQPAEALAESVPGARRAEGPPLHWVVSLLLALPLLFVTRASHTPVAHSGEKEPLRVSIAPVLADRTRPLPVEPSLVAEELQMHLARVQPQLIRVVEPGAPSDVRIETTLQDTGKAVRLSAKIVESSSGRPVWTETLNRELTDTSDFPLAIALRVTHAVSMRYLPAGRHEPLVRSQVSAAALAVYRKGRALRHGRYPAHDRDGALVHFQEAVKLEPRFAEAWSGIGDIWSKRAMRWRGDSRAMALKEARVALARAVALDPRSVEALADQGQLLLQHDRRYAEAEVLLRRAIAADPDYVDAHIAMTILKGAMGDIDAAVASFRRVQLLDPQVHVPSLNLAFLYLVGNRADDAISEYHAGLLQLQNPFVAHWGMMWAAMSSRRWDVAATSLSAILEEPVDLGGQNDSGARFRQEFRRLEPKLLAMERVKLLDAYGLACFYSEVHEADKAFEALDRAIASRSFLSIYTYVDPRLDYIRADPRFDERLVQLGFRR